MKKEIQLYSVVISTEQIGTIPKGTTGTVVYIHEPFKKLEVEFSFNNSSILETVTKSQIKLK